MNFWRQTTHIMSYFPEENFRGEKRLPKSFMEGFLEVSTLLVGSLQMPESGKTNTTIGPQLD